MKGLLRVCLVLIVVLGGFIIFFLMRRTETLAFYNGGGTDSPYPPPSVMTNLEPYPPPELALSPSTPITGNGETIEDDPALLLDAEMYAKINGVSTKEAVNRLKLQREIGNLNAKLSEAEKDSFAGLWIQHQPDFRVIIRFTKVAESIIEPYLRNNSLADIIDLQTANVSLNDLEKHQMQSAQICKQLDITCNSSINIKENDVELYVVRPENLDTALQSAKVQLPANVKIMKIDKEPEQVQDINGGLPLQDVLGLQCTSGFTVVSNSNFKGVTTSGHCPDSLYYNGVLLPWAGGTVGGDYDIQWNRGDQSFTVKNWLYDGYSGRSISYETFRTFQTVGEFVCKYGITSVYGCAQIGSTSYNGVDIRVDDIVVSCGDSGGPWFVGPWAYGTTIYSCTLSNGHPCAIYGPVDHIHNILNLKIFMNQVYLPIIEN